MVKVEKISQNGLSRTDLYVEGDFGAIDKEIGVLFSKQSNTIKEGSRS